MWSCVDLCGVTLKGNLVDIFILIKYLHRSAILLIYSTHKDSWRAGKGDSSLFLNVEKKNPKVFSDLLKLIELRRDGNQLDHRVFKA